MSQNHLETNLEKEVLNKTLDFIESLIVSEKDAINIKEEDLISYRREMYENTSHNSQDFNKLSETVQYLNPLTMQTIDYEATLKRLDLYKRMYSSPYFARIDFESERWGKETIYIGTGNLENEDTFENYVYDWRAPISSMFYRYELGSAGYSAPAGEIEGIITLKRQFEIRDSKLEYFFDSSVNIVDEILRDALSKNTSVQMRTIVETIQREQDLVIRDVENDLLMVQGVAGSGKTSIALHRVAYLMYQGLTSRLKASNILLISPNNLFAQYISGVLPELGEENVSTITFEKVFFNNYPEDVNFSKRNSMLEEMFTAEKDKRRLIQDELEFKNSPEFLELINRLISYYESSLVNFNDIMYGGKTIAKKELLKARLLESSGRSLPLQVRLFHIETVIRNRIQQARPKRIKKLEDYLSRKPEYSFDLKAQARLLNTKQVSRTMKHVREFTKIDYLGLYKKLFFDKSLFKKLSAGLSFPKNIDAIIEHTVKRLNSDSISYNDAMVILLLKLRMDANYENQEIRQVVVDEAQDYSLVHFEILSRLFPTAKYTVLGDINQMLVGLGSSDIYSAIQKVLAKKTSRLVNLTKSFRCSVEITDFSRQFVDNPIDFEQLERHEKAPSIIYKANKSELVDRLLTEVSDWKSEGYGTIAIICKSAKAARQLYKEIAHRCEVAIFSSDEVIAAAGTIIMPVYLAKGLEFDAVAIYDADEESYSIKDDKRLLYVAATRALHRLSVFYSGKLSPLIGE